MFDNTSPPCDALVINRMGDWMIRALMCLLGTVLLVGCSSEDTGSALSLGEAPSPAAVRTHKAVMDHYKVYTTLPEPKVLTGCFVDDASKSPPLRLRRVFAWHTAQSSDGPIFAGQLRREAMKSCLGWGAGENLDCDCRLIDMSGKNVLKL